MVNKNSRKLGIIFIVLALLFINLIPDPTDLLTLPIYSAFTGADVSPDNLSSIYMDFTIWSFFVGMGFLLAGMYLLGWSVKRLWKKLGIEKYSIAILFAIISVLVVSFFEINSVWLIFSIVPIIYWLTIKKDKSECLGLFITSGILLLGGLEILASFIFKRIPIPEVINSNNIFLGWLATTLGFAQITNIVLISSVFISFLLVILVAKVLKEKF